MFHVIRHAAVVAVFCSLAPSSLYAQSADFTVTTESAKIYASPSTGSVAIGEVRRGTVFEVTRELGSWVRVPWPAAPDGGGYVHVSWGRVTHHVSQAPAATATPASSLPEPPSAPAASKSLERTNVGTSPTSPSSLYVVPPTHAFGLGGRMNGTTLGYGLTARTWSRGHLGLQVDASRYQLDGQTSLGRVVSMQLAPTVLFSLANRVTDFVWLRPYVGAGPSFVRQTYKADTLTELSQSANGLGFQSFGGSEFTFASVPQVAFSVDAGYRWVENKFNGFDFSGAVYSVSAHWYLK